MSQGATMLCISINEAADAVWGAANGTEWCEIRRLDERRCNLSGGITIQLFTMIILFWFRWCGGCRTDPISISAAWPNAILHIGHSSWLEASNLPAGRMICIHCCWMINWQVTIVLCSIGSKNTSILHGNGGGVSSNNDELHVDILI